LTIILILDSKQGYRITYGGITCQR